MIYRRTVMSRGRYEMCWRRKSRWIMSTSAGGTARTAERDPLPAAAAGRCSSSFKRTTRPSRETNISLSTRRNGEQTFLRIDAEDREWEKGEKGEKMPIGDTEAENHTRLRKNTHVIVYNLCVCGFEQIFYWISSCPLLNSWPRRWLYCVEVRCYFWQ